MVKKNITIMKEVHEEQWNNNFKKALREEKTTGKTQYWMETINKMMENALNKLRKELDFTKEEMCFIMRCSECSFEEDDEERWNKISKRCVRT